MSVESIIIYSQSDLDICRVVLKNLNIKPYDTRALQLLNSMTINILFQIEKLVLFPVILNIF